MPVAGAKVTPLGSLPEVRLNNGAGNPVAATVNDPDVPTVNVVLFALVKAGTISTASPNVWAAFVPTPLFAVIVRSYIPTLAAPNPVVVLIVAVPFPLSVNVTPAGNVPLSVSAGAGNPVAVTVNALGAPTSNVTLFELMISGA
jgi:hypothetical protein